MVWYHGRNVKSTEFSYKYVGKGHDQEGAGFYFTSNKEDAFKYADKNGIIITAKLAPRKLVSTTARPNLKDLKFLIMSAPDYEGSLSNWGENLNNAMRQALQVYSDYDNAAEAFQVIENDFYKGVPGKYLEALVRLGYDGHIVNGYIQDNPIKHFICYNPQIIHIQKVENVADLSKNDIQEIIQEEYQKIKKGDL